MKTKNINHRLTLPGKPANVFAALMDSDQHSRFTGQRARIDARPAGAFTCYGDYINGITLELKRNKRIVQAWRSQGWREGHYSVVTYTLTSKSGGRTGLHFLQVGVPTDDYADKNKGWRTHYWEPLKRFLAGREHKKSGNEG